MIFIAALILGLTANFHCIGMCGPLALAIPVNRSSNWTILFGVLQYNFGRIITYSALGAVVGIIGITINTFGVLQWISILSGIFMIIYAWRKWLGSKLETKLPMFGLNKVVSSGLGKVLASKSPFKILFLGSLNGLLPCGMVYLALMNAILAGNSLSSAGAMALFGLGTLPAMVFVGFAANRISSNFRYKISKAIPYMLTVVGVLVVLRGMNLDIPYISPKISLMEEKKCEITKEKKGEKTVEMSCCHKK
ncbi:MAG: sulfite exporter TauE/SafE family protein [Flavobacteriia bacterium]|jgi:sulfite exporter TauE/SafE